MADGAALFAQPCRFFFASDALSGHFGHVGEVGTAECLESLELPGWQAVRCLGQKNGHDISVNCWLSTGLSAAVVSAHRSVRLSTPQPGRVQW